ncbi:MAG: FG-GAP-like repeat-containing protein, partial [Methanofastidiosum sp.]
MNKLKSVFIISIMLVSMFFVLNTVYGQAYPRIQWDFYDSDITSFRYHQPTLADIDKDGKMEVIHAEENDDIVFCLETDGALKWKTTFIADVYESTVKVADVDGDGWLDVVYGDEDGDYENSIVCISGQTGAFKWSSGNSGSDMDSIPSIGDINNDGIVEVLATNDDYILFCIDGRNGNELWRYDDRSVGNGMVAPVLVDVDGDGQLEIIVIGQDNYDEIVCIETNGSEKWHFTGSKDYGAIYVTPTVADFDGDGRPEIVFSNEYGIIYMVEHDGKEKWVNDDILSIYVGIYPAYQNVVSGDLDNDRDIEIVVPAYYGLMVFDHRGNLLWQKNDGLSGNDEVGLGYSYVTLCDINNDNKVEILYNNYNTGKIEARDYLGNLLWA